MAAKMIRAFDNGTTPILDGVEPTKLVEARPPNSKDRSDQAGRYARRNRRQPGVFAQSLNENCGPSLEEPQFSDQVSINR
jgi:hypothetical protein